MASAKNGVESVKQNAPDAAVVDLTKRLGLLTGLGNSGYQSLGPGLLVRMSGLAPMARSETKS